jgi:hypothetical protein
MKRLGISGLAVIAGLAALSVAATSASAEAPEFGRCVKVAKGTGKYKSGNCTVELAGGSYEWMPGPGPNSHFTLALKEGYAVFDTVGGVKFTCPDVKGTGEYTGTKTVGRLLITLTGCETAGGKVETPGQPEGRVVLSPLAGVLGVVKKGETRAKDIIGLDLFPEESGGPVFQVTVSGTPLEERGSVISLPVKNRMLATATIKFVEVKGKQKPERFEGEPKDVLEENSNGGPFEQAGLTMLFATQTNEEPMEINSVF